MSLASKSYRNQRGQIVVEYVLLMSIAVALGLIIVTLLIKRGDADSPENSGALIKKWNGLEETIGNDAPN